MLLNKKNAKVKLKKYRGLGIIALGMFFNVIESVIFAKNGSPFNLDPLSVGEWICDIISSLIVIFGLMMATYDMWNFKPKKIITYTRINDITEKIVIEE